MKRTTRLNEQLRRELTELLMREVRDPRTAGVTITDVEVSPDLYHAKVFFSIMGDETVRDTAAAGLRAAAGFLRSAIGRRLHIRRSPELHFTFDESLQYAQRIERLLAEARADASRGDDAVDFAEDDSANSADGDSADGDSADGDSADGDSADGDSADPTDSAGDDRPHDD